MKIMNSLVVISSDHQSESKYTETEKLDVWVDPPRVDLGVDRISLSEAGKDLASAKTSTASVGGMENSIEGGPKWFLLKEIIEAFTGKKITVLKPSDIDQTSKEAESNRQGSPQETGGGQPERAGWGIRYDYYEAYTEKENTTFRAEGIVKTADGKEITFTVDLNMSREFAQSTEISLRAGDATRVDPLVINFKGTAAQLTDERFAFDLNSDGISETLPFVSSGSGLLVFDRNGDQQVNDGRELFGPHTGDGFAELSQYDDDGNRWIDEHESIYENLSVWTRDRSGKDILRGLKESGIGAIYVGRVDTAFGLKDSNNDLQGQITRSGVYLAEEGWAGTIQQLDLVI
jgi:hypothetical protein